MISGIVLAAGMSSRMGRPKLILPWGDTTVIARVVDALQQGGVDEILVVTDIRIAHEGCGFIF